MSVAFEIVPYSPELLHVTGQIIQEVSSVLDSTLGLSDTLARFQSDASREGFGGLLVRVGERYVGASVWFDVTGRELNDRWRPRYTPREKVPSPAGSGVLLHVMGILPKWRGRGLGRALLEASLAQIEPTHDWIAMSLVSESPAAVSLFQNYGFEALPLVSSNRRSLCVMKFTRQAEPHQ
ncbi:MAG: GNAT family N-acetyltransferase [Anaerolinea sp.]|mgnify:CR=1 FL=1|nr:GNAT family N-acetyltransferase [Anaerolinea sp.]MCC6974602.1 GNAT family N-acetyltransferase [Anaerolineae bacterium]